MSAQKKDVPMKPKRYNEQERDFWYALDLEEDKAFRELELAMVIGDPIGQSKALGRLKRTMMDYFAERFLTYEGNYGGKPCYSINYKYHKDWQEGDDFSITERIKEIDARKPIYVSGVGLYTE